MKTMAFSLFSRLKKEVPCLSRCKPFQQYRTLPKVYQDFRRSSCFRHRNTIFAVSSGHGKSGVAIIRISGPETLNVIKSMACYPNLKVPKPRYASLRNIINPQTQDILDEGLCLWFPKPHSFTGEDCCEFQVHGSLAVLLAILACLSSQPQLRPAEPGEFTRRAFYNRRLDLTQVEALADLIDSETEAQRRQAVGQMKGNLSHLYTKWRQEILECLASVEAYIDFSEDELIEDDILNSVQERMEGLRDSIQKHIEVSNKCGVRIRSGIKTVIVGEPNVGKSSLMNLLSQKQTSIVTPVPGTTRDIIEKHLDIAGFPVVLLDTAGLRHSTSDAVETQGIDRARLELANCDLTVIVLAFHPSLLQDFKHQLHIYTNQILDLQLEVDSVLMRKSNSENLGEQLEDRRYLIVINKIDLATPESQDQLLEAISDYDNVIALSCTRGMHTTRFLDCLQKQLTILCGNLNAAPLAFTSTRHAHHLQCALSHIESFFELLTRGRGFELTLAAEQLRLAVRSLGSITGHVQVDEVLQVIFSSFCIGK